MFGGGGFGGGFGGPMGGGGMGRRLRSALDSGDDNATLGKIYDAKVMRRMPKYLAWVKKYLAIAGTGTIIRTFTNIATPYVVAVIADHYIST